MKPKPQVLDCRDPAEPTLRFTDFLRDFRLLQDVAIFGAVDPRLAPAIITSILAVGFGCGLDGEV